MQPPLPKSALSARGLTFAYGREPVFEGLDLEVPAGSTVAIMGRSGSGKSTLLHLLAGLLAPCAGDVQVDGAPFGSLSERQRDDVRLREMGVVFQFGELLPELTLLENVQLPLLLLGRRRRDATTAAAEALSRVGLEREKDRSVAEVSGGQQQRAAVARALVHSPSIVLADEPTGALDDANAAQILDLVFSSGGSRRQAVVCVTHSRAVADRCDQVYVLASGRLEPVAMV